MRDPEKISAIIDEFDLTGMDGANKLEAKLRGDLTIREIEFFAKLLHGGRFSSDAGWTRDHSGHVCASEKEDARLSALWDKLMSDALFSLGAATVVEMQSAKMVGRAFFTDEGDGPSLYDLTLDEIAKKIPVGLKDRIDRDLAPERKKRKQQSASIGGDVAKLQRDLAEGAQILQNVLAENAALKAKLSKNGIS